MRVWIALGILITVILAVNLVTSVFTDKNCPKNVYGTNNTTYIKYFSSPLCFACWLQKPVIEHLAAEKGDRFLLEEYDSDFCRDVAAPHYIRGVPAFLKNDTVIYGLQSEKELGDMIG